MLIRSQDKHILINMNDVSSLEVGDDGLRIFADEGNTIYEIGKYLNEGKAKRRAHYNHLERAVDAEAAKRFQEQTAL